MQEKHLIGEKPPKNMHAIEISIRKSFIEKLRTEVFV